MSRRPSPPVPHIVVIGSSNTDMIIEVDAIPRPGETVLGGRFRTAGGGKGANQAIGAARAGGRVSFVGRVGKDAWGDAALLSLRENSINVSHVTRDRDLPSGVALILIDRRGQNSIAVAGGANEKLLPTHLRGARATLRKARVILVQLESPLETVEAAAAEAARGGALFILNPAPARKLPRSLFDAVSVLTPNESEAELLTGVRIDSMRSAKQAALLLLKRGVKTVVMTLGSRGALIADQMGARLCPGFRVDAVDTVAAGDTFNGALAVALADGEVIDLAVRFANAAASISVTRRGAQESAPQRHEIQALLRKFPLR